MPRWSLPLPPHHLKINITLKTILKFGSTAHICIGVIFWYFLLTLNDTIIHKSNHPNTSAPVMALQYFIYFFFFLPFGICLHRGVQKESVLILEWIGGCFFLLQVYGGLIQYQYGFLISTFFSVRFPSLNLNSDPLIEILVGLSTSLLYMTLICFYVRELRGQFYVPPIYPSRVDYFYYPTDTSANVTVFHKQVPVTIMHNYHNTAYFIQTTLPSTSTNNTHSTPNGKTQTRNTNSKRKRDNKLNH